MLSDEAPNLFCFVREICHLPNTTIHTFTWVYLPHCSTKYLRLHIRATSNKSVRQKVDDERRKPANQISVKGHKVDARMKLGQKYPPGSSPLRVETKTAPPFLAILHKENPSLVLWFILVK